MSTVAAINVRTTEGKTVHIMNYHDGYVGSTGAMLVAFYNSFEKAKALIKRGDLNSLEQKLPSREFIETVTKEVMAGDISKIPANPYNIYDGDDLAEAVKEHKCINNMRDYVACRFDLECTALPLFTINDENGKKIMHLDASSNTDFRGKQGFGAGEYTYLFDQKQMKWFLTDEVGNVLCAVEDELRKLDRGWTVNSYMEKRASYRKRLLDILKKLQNEFAKQHRTDNLGVENNRKTIQSKIMASHRPQTVRELNDWLRRMNVASKFRVRTVLDKNCRCLAVQEFTRNGKWKAVGKCGVSDYNTVINYLQQFVPVDWPM